MQDTSTWAGMIVLNLTMHVHCSKCERCIEVEISNMPPEDKPSDAAFRCSQCGRPGSKIVSHRSANYSYPGAKPHRR
jgi:hypothetical protein